MSVNVLNAVVCTFPAHLGYTYISSDPKNTNDIVTQVTANDNCVCFTVALPKE